MDNFGNYQGGSGYGLRGYTTCNQCGQSYYAYATHFCPGATTIDIGQFQQNVFRTTSPITIGAKMDGTKFTVICSDTWEQFDTIDKAQAKAEELAHAESADAFILKPIKKVSPKRDVVTTDL